MPVERHDAVLDAEIHIVAVDIGRVLDQRLEALLDALVEVVGGLGVSALHHDLVGDLGVRADGGLDRVGGAAALVGGVDGADRRTTPAPWSKFASTLSSSATLSSAPSAIFSTSGPR